MNNLEQFFILLTAVASSTAIWKFLEAKLKMKAEQRKQNMENSDSTQYRADLQKRVEEMSQALEEANQKILQLTEEVAELRTENKYLQREIDILKSRYAEKKIREILKKLGIFFVLYCFWHGICNINII